MFGSGVIPALLLRPGIAQIGDDDLRKAAIALSTVFLVGIALNWNLLVSASEVYQASLDKLNPISLGAIATSLALVLLLLPTTHIRQAVLRYGSILILLGIAAFSQARGPMISTAGALIAIGALSPKSYRHILVRVGVVVAAVLLLLPLFTKFNLMDFALERFFKDPSQFSNLENDSIWIRQRSWHAAWDQFIESPIIGNKVFEPTRDQYPHNLILESLISVGILGSSLFFLHIVICIRACFRLLASPAATGVDRITAALWVKEIIAAQFSGAYYGNPTFIILSVGLITLSSSRAPAGRTQLTIQDSNGKPRNLHARHYRPNRSRPLADQAKEFSGS
jgi:O-antigen ligase